ncbi:MAG TPA: Ran-binding zinc finger domain-containing protein [Thermoplasmata archaeon]|nr:Ran-binding zinc finger domain-containing protein [Thermoplasmata archaeon]
MPRSTARAADASPPRAAIVLALVGGLFIVGFAGLHLSASVVAFQKCNPPPPGTSCTYLDLWNLSPPLQLVADLAALALGLVVLAAAVLLWRAPHRHEALGLVILVASGASAVGYGGAIIGLFLGGLGGLFALTHRAGRPARMATWDPGSTVVPPATAETGAPTRAPPPVSAPPAPFRPSPVEVAPPRETPPPRPGSNPLLRPWNEAAPDELPPIPWPPKEARPVNGSGPTIPPELQRPYAPLPRPEEMAGPSAPTPPELPEPLPLSTAPTPGPPSAPPRPTSRASAPRSPSRGAPTSEGALPALPTGPRRRPRTLRPASVPAPPAPAPAPAGSPAPAPAAEPVSAETPAAPAPPTPRAPGSPTGRHAWQCARCGLVNAPWSMSCTRCKAPAPQFE